MYLKIGENQYSCTKRIKSAAGTLKFLGVSPSPGEVSGTIQMYRDDGFLMSEDDTSQYIRQKYAGTLLAFFSYPEPEPVPTPAPEPRATNAQSLAAVNFARMMLPSMASTMSADDTITVAALYDDWTDGSYQVGISGWHGTTALTSLGSAVRSTTPRPTRTLHLTALHGVPSGFRSTGPRLRPPRIGLRPAAHTTSTRPGSIWSGRMETRTYASRLLCTPRRNTLRRGNSILSERRCAIG